MHCKKCGEEFGRLACLAMLIDLGVVCSQDPSVCSEDGGEHVWVNEEPTENDFIVAALDAGREES
jgi:hypothetical protein